MNYWGTFLLTFFLSYITYLLSLLSVSVLSVMNFTVAVLRFIIFGAFQRIEVCSSNKAKQHRYLNYNYLLTRRERKIQVSYSKAYLYEHYTNIVRLRIESVLQTTISFSSISSWFSSVCSSYSTAKLPPYRNSLFDRGMFFDALNRGISILSLQMSQLR